MRRAWLTGLVAALWLLALPASAQRELVRLDHGWHFALGSAASPADDFGCGTEYFNFLTKAGSIHNTGPYAPSFAEDARWKPVDLPHDWAVDLPFAPEASYSHGFKTLGWKYPGTSVGWYRKTFTLPETDRGRHIRLQLDGAFRDTRVWVNGFYLGREESGYKGQDYDITDYLLYGRENLLTVRCDASLEEGWFYEGAGLYRHVRLLKTDPLHLATDGISVQAKLSEDYSQALLTLRAEVCNDDREACPPCEVRCEVVDPSGKVVARTGFDTCILESRESFLGEAGCTVEAPELWSTETPSLYTLRTLILSGADTLDACSTRFGIREVKLDPDNGLFLNGKPLKLKGFNLHQDHAGVGAAIPDGLQRYRIRKLKGLGGNALRSSHNPMTPELLDICDEEGILVFEETRLLGSNPYQTDLLQWMIRRDRNHPSVFLWGVGNEEWGVEWEERGTAIAATMQAYARLADPSRPVAVASSSGPHILQGVEVAGYNYIRQHPIDEHRRNYPARIAFGSEETTGCGTRGVFFDDQREQGRMPSRLLTPTDSIGLAVEYGWQFYKARPWLLGLFWWTGFDYRGEPTPLDYPCTGSLFGLLDYCGFPKDEAWYLKAWWTEEPVLHVFPHWNLQGHEGEAVTLYVFSNCEEVELRVNGRRLGRKSMPRDGHLSWETVYQPGRVEAIGYTKGRKVLRKCLETSGTATALTAEVSAWDEGLRVVDLTLRDSRGREVPTASLPLRLEFSGAARLLGAGNGDSAFTGQERPADPAARSFCFSSFNGHAQLLLQVEGAATLTLSGEGIEHLIINDL